jgi:hypothetical protein
VSIVTDGGKQPWKAAVLALTYPGLGHLYLRAWRRGLAWLGLIFVVSQLPIALFSPETALNGRLNVDTVLAAARAIPLYLPLLTVGVVGLSTVDAYRQAERGVHHRPRSRGRSTRGRQSATRCPHCGESLGDAELDFCQWCAEPLDEPPEDGGLFTSR